MANSNWIPAQLAEQVQQRQQQWDLMGQVGHGAEVIWMARQLGAPRPDRAAVAAAPRSGVANANVRWSLPADKMHLIIILANLRAELESQKLHGQCCPFGTSDGVTCQAAREPQYQRASKAACLPACLQLVITTNGSDDCANYHKI